MNDAMTVFLVTLLTVIVSMTTWYFTSEHYEKRARVVAVMNHDLVDSLEKEIKRQKELNKSNVELIADLSRPDTDEFHRKMHDFR